MTLLNNYETIYILKPDVTEDTNFLVVNNYKVLLKEQGAENISVQHRGRRHLSYNIAHYYDGIYVQMNYEASGALVKILEESMKINESIVRYLTIKQPSYLANIY